MSSAIISSLEEEAIMPECFFIKIGEIGKILKRMKNSTFRGE
jgi:hypothetical protein